MGGQLNLGDRPVWPDSVTSPVAHPGQSRWPCQSRCPGRRRAWVTVHVTARSLAAAEPGRGEPRSDPDHAMMTDRGLGLEYRPPGWTHCRDFQVHGVHHDPSHGQQTRNFKLTRPGRRPGNRDREITAANTAEISGQSRPGSEGHRPGRAGWVRWPARALS